MVLSAPEIEQGGEDAGDVLPGVGRTLAVAGFATDIDGEIVGVFVEVAENLEVVGRRIFGRGDGVFADVAPDQDALVGFAQHRNRLFQPPVAEPHAVYDRLVPGQPENPGPWIPGLGPGRDGADLDEAEAEGRQLAERLAVAVEAGGQPHRIGEPQAEDLAFERGVLGGVELAEQPPAARQRTRDAQQEHDRAVGAFDVHAEQDGLYDPAVKHVRCLFVRGVKDNKRIPFGQKYSSR